jgi:hypothetical protein
MAERQLTRFASAEALDDVLPTTLRPEKDPSPDKSEPDAVDANDIELEEEEPNSDGTESPSNRFSSEQVIEIDQPDPFSEKDQLVPMDDFVGDPLHDLPAAEEGGIVVGLVQEKGGDLDSFMNRYGLSLDNADDIQQKHREWLEGLVPTWAQGAWLQYLSAAWADAESRAIAEEEALKESAAEAAAGGLKMRFQMMGMNSADGRAPDGTIQIAWSMFRMACKYINKTNLFHNFFIILIVFNTIYMGFEVDNDWSEDFDVEAVDHTFVALFFVEMVIRLTATDNFSGENAFLYFDSAIVMLSVFDMWVLPLLLRVNADINLRVVHVFRVCRIVRLARLLRLVTFLRPLRLMERSLRRGVIHFCTIMGFLCAYLYACSLIFKNLMKDEDSRSVFENTPENFTGNVLKLMVYLFEAMLSGFDWLDKMRDPLVTQTSTRAVGVLLLIFMFCTKIVLWNVIVSSMVENYITTSQMDKFEMEEGELYRKLDVHGFQMYLTEADQALDGRVTWEEFLKFVQTHANGPKLLHLLGIKTKVTDEKERMEQNLAIRKVFQALDIAGEESIPYEVFTLGYVKLKGSNKELQGLLTDYLLKRVLQMVRHQENLVQPMEHHIVALDGMLYERLRHLQFIQIDMEDIVRPVEERLSKLEVRFSEMADSLKFPDADASVVPAAAATMASMTLQTEIEALKKAAEDFLSSRGRPNVLLDGSPVPAVDWLKLMSSSDLH